MNFAGKWGVMEMMVADYEERQEKLQKIIEYVKKSDESVVNINGICKQLGIKLTGEEMQYICSQCED